MIRCCCKLNFIKLAFHFVWTIKQSMFVYWLYDTLNKALGFFGGGVWEQILDIFYSIYPTYLLHNSH